MNILGIVGWSGSGKTDLVCRIIKKLSQKILVASIKHSHHNFNVDKKGKDSFKHIQAGSQEVILFNEYKFAMITQKKKKKISFNEVINKFSKNTDIILVEGMKNSPLKKIEVFRSELKKPFLYKNDKNIIAIVADKIDKRISNINLPVFNFNETQRICNFILKEVKNSKI